MSEKKKYRGKVEIIQLEEVTPECMHWKDKTPLERLYAAQGLRENSIKFKYGKRPPLQRILTITKREKG